MPFPAEHCQQGQQQAQFAAASRLTDQFRDRSLRPAVAGQGRIQSGMTGAESGYAMCGLPATPEQRVSA
jgi:hypothetical protein